jgi:hypothetical protein
MYSSGDRFKTKACCSSLKRFLLSSINLFSSSMSFCVLIIFLSKDSNFAIVESIAEADLLRL